MKKYISSKKKLCAQRGGALIAVITLCTALLIVSAAFFSVITGSYRINHRSLLLAEAREGAEGVLGMVTAELNRRAVSYSSLSSSAPLSGYALSSTDLAFFAGSGTNSNIVSSSIDFTAGKLSSATTSTTLLANDPVYKSDTSTGLTLGVRSGYIYAKASTKDPVTSSLITSYVSGLVQVREQTWFNYGVFYNMDMEFHPGVQMDMKGAVHTNANLYLASDGSVVNFYKKVTAAGSIYRGKKYDLTDTGFSGSVYCASDSSGTLVSMSYSQDCRSSSWTTLETSRWNKYVMDSSLSVSTFTPTGLPEYVAEDYATSGIQLRNNGYAMIEPQLSSSSSEVRYYGRKTDDVENLKFSALAGMTIVVDDIDRSSTAAAAGYTSKIVSNSGYAIPWKMVWYKGETDATIPVNKNNLPVRDSSAGLPTVLGTIDPFARNDEIDKYNEPSSSVTISMRRNLKALLRDAIVVVPYHDGGGSSTSYGTGTTSVAISSYPSSTVTFSTSTFTTDLTYRYTQPAGQYPNLNDNSTVAETTTNTYSVITSSSDPYPTTSYSGTGGFNSSTGAYSGLYDRRQGFNGTTGVSLTTGSTTDYNNGLKGAMNVVYVDMAKLNWIINHSTLWTNPTTGAVIYNPATSYTGIIYIDLPSDAKTVDYNTRSALTDPDDICHAARTTTTKPGWCVIIKNAKRLARLTSDTSLRDDGLTIASNGPIYLKGNYNADGNSATGNTILPDSDASTATTSDSSLWYSTTYPDAEVPALVAGDAVTFLTEGFSTANSNKTRYDGSTSSTSSNFMEISTAVITGITATIPKAYDTGMKWSGGVHNFPRFLEDLSPSSSITVRYRGSMAALFENEVSVAPFVQGSHSYWYDPPTRAWGYHAYLAAGRYPPGTPVIRTARLMGVKDIPAATYTTGPTQPE